MQDLRDELGLDVPTETVGALSAINATAPVVQEYIRQKFSLTADGQAIPIEFTENKIYYFPSLGNFAQYAYKTPQIEVPDRLVVHNALLLPEGSNFRSLLTINCQTREREALAILVFNDSVKVQEVNFSELRGVISPLAFIWQGILHIWIGTDHILFIVSLMLPVVLVRNMGNWVPVDSFRKSVWGVVKIVTLFTIAHSMTLSLAFLNIIELPSRLVESLIALSIVVVALVAILPHAKDSTGWIIFFFGLFHGMGFASVMGHLPFRTSELIGTLFGFNAGVEIGQLAIVGSVFPVLFLMRKTRFYIPIILKGGSGIIGLIAFVWFLERAFLD